MKPLPSELSTELNIQIGRELSASLAYMQMGYAFAQLGLLGLSLWAEGQSKEEIGHANQIAQYMIRKRNTQAAIPSLPAPQSLYGMTVLQLVQTAQVWEASITEALTALYTLAESVEDEGVCLLMQDYLAEQEKSEAEVLTLATLCALADDEGAAILQLDQRFSPKVKLPL